MIYYIFIVLVIEIILIVICLTLLIIYYFISIYRKRRYQEVQEKLRELFLNYLTNPTEEQYEKIQHLKEDQRDLLTVLESYDLRFSDEPWRNIKKAILTEDVLKKSRQMTESKSWVKRDIGIRFLKLAIEKEDEPIILRLLDDPHSLVRIQAALCAVKLGTRPLIEQLLHRMTKESVLGRYPYRDALIKSKKEVFVLLENIMKTEKNEEIRFICLDVLSTRVAESLLPVVEEYLQSGHLENKIAAMRILANFPREKSIQHLMQFLSNKDWQVRLEAARGLGILVAVKSIPLLAIALNDPIWEVRLQAALSLKKMGEEGLIILSRQDPDINQQAFETAQYALALPT